MSEIRFHYFRITNDNFPKKNKGIVIAATKVNPCESTRSISFAFCSPRDKFIKAIGRDICMERLEKWKCYTVPKSDNSWQDSADTFNKILTNKPMFCRSWWITPYGIVVHQ